MKKLAFCFLIITSLIISGCSSKSASSTTNNTNKNSTSDSQVSTTAATPTPTTDNPAATNPTAANQTTVKSNFEPIKPNTVPQLSTQQKKQVDSKLNSALKNLDNALKSIQDPSDIDLDSVN